MAKIVIFGTQDFAQLAHFYFKNDTEHEVVAFTLDKKYMSATELMGLPVVDFETVQLIYPPSEYQLFVPMSPTKINIIFNRGINSQETVLVNSHMSRNNRM